ncbi:MAG: tetratricopeptide repeat protein [Desulfobacterales bacterium]|nr:tetratricopeptide repeat protein [Desulfobacterales bacterium]
MNTPKPTVPSRPDPKILEAIFRRAMEMVETGKLDAAVSEFKTLLTLVPDQAAVHFNLGNALRRLGRNEEAAACFRRSLDLEPDDPQAHYNLGNALTALGRIEEATACLERATRIAPTFADAHFNLGGLLLSSGDHAAAAQRFRTVIELKENHFSAHLQLGRALIFDRHGKQAIPVLRSALAMAPDNADACIALGNAFFEIDRFDDAVVAYRKAIDLEDDNPDYLYNLGNAYYRQSRLEEAVGIFQRAAQLAPANAAIFFNLGNAYHRMGMMQRAADCFLKASELDSTNEEAAHMLAAMTGRTTTSAPKAWVRRLFDQYSDRFEQHLTEDLGYAAPEQLADALKSVTGPSPVFSHALDLGCGTGLSGLPFRAMTRRLTGIDLSENMVAAARKKQVYDDLRVDGIIEFLSATTKRYDLVIATDVLIYLGAADALFGLIGRQTSKDAAMVLSIEATTDADYVLRSTGRYAHSDSYIHRLARGNGFAVRSCLPARIRKEAGHWIMGSLFVLKKEAI